MDSPPVESGRGPDGKFLPGKSGNPSGRPRNELLAHQRDLEGAIREHLSADKVKRIINKLVEQAEGGDTKAAKIILDKLVPNAIESNETAEPGRVVIFRIENATFAAKQVEQQTDQTAAVIDVTAEEVKSE